MKRRDVIRGLGAASITTVVAAGGAAARTTGGFGDVPDASTDCSTDWHKDDDCWFSQRCSEINCPRKCCECLCLE